MRFFYLFLTNVLMVELKNNRPDFSETYDT